nr:reverse transcriptase domain-containing protein [Tanacetum cinerariifolium]
MFLGKYFPPSMVTKLRNEITNFRQRPDGSLFEACECYKLSIDRCPNHNMLPVTQIDTFYNGLTLRHRDTINAAAGGTFMKRHLKECYDLIENITAHHNDWDTSAQWSESPSSITSSFDSKIIALKAEMTEINKNRMRVLQVKQQLKAVTPKCETCGGPHSYTDCPATVGQTQNVYAAGAYQGGNSYQPQGNIVTNPKEDLKGITTRSGTVYQGPTIPTTSSSSPQVVEREIEVTNYTVPPTNNESTKDVQPSVVQVENPIPNSEPVVALIIEPVVALAADRLISRPVGVAEDVFVKVGTFHFPADFVVINFDADPRVPLILERSFLKTGRALIDVFEGELTLCIGKEAITFNLDQTSRYSANYNDMTANRIDIIDMACEEYSQEVLGFSNVIASGNPTPYYDPIVSTSSPTLTSFGDNDFLLEEVDAFLALEDDPTSPKVDHSYELKICEAKTDKSSIDEPPEVEHKDLPPYPEYAFLEGNDKWPVIIAKDLSDEEKIALITVLKSHKRAIAWKLFDIKGINPEFYTHKILMGEYFKPAVQHQRSPWVSLVHCVPKKGGFTVVENEENELIPTRLVTGWRVCIDHRKLNEATRKDHFPLPFMDQMLERLAANEYYCFLDGNVVPAKEQILQKCITFGMTPFFSKSVRIKSLGGVFMARKPLTFSRLATMDPPGDIMARTTPPRRERFCNEMKCHKIPSKFARFLTFRASILWGRSRQHEGTNIYSWPSTTCRNRTHFCNDQFAKVMLKYGVTHRLAIAYHPQTSGQVEVSNCGLKRILERTVRKNRASWSEKLDDALWAFRTAYKTPTGCSLYKLVYRKACHLSIELEHKAYWALKHANFDLQTMGDQKKVQLNELNELRDQTYENSLIHKEKTKRLYDSKIKDCVFKFDDRVLLFNSRLNIFLGKLKTRWSGPFTITHVFPYGTVELS